jgi:hypothetical protein
LPRASSRRPASALQRSYESLAPSPLPLPPRRATGASWAGPAA